MTHSDLRFQRTYSLQCNTDNDQDRGTAERYVGVGDSGEDDREDGNDTEEQSAKESDLRNDLREVINRGLAGSDAGDRAIVFANRIRNLYGVELNRRVEVVEREDQQEIKYTVDDIVIMEKCMEN